ncbi:glycoside hydrolase family 16 protein [Suhomyces tanzawaensis NRRL Y-17324]|uniref:Crh-like protein n=1 Tax=Suhomyces tanzawaensis NRRL Y-17324 TaxID=984487 RepID=A0A1E4SG65_9ASCO|nr:glycoside hydrolase family 16 protein [Suhomyces tanzawaensis NRRL Y-17324]ODV78402.1 glycoside hydrolase family 16 protein [Suhomyces tanzawaensis NRRL Y-17324]
MKGLLTLLPLISHALAACNPLESQGCSPNPALATTFKESFNSSSTPYFTVLKNKGDVTFGDDGVTLTIKNRFDNPTIKSNFYIMFGRVEVVMQAAQGQGIVSSFYLQSDALDEIDIELFGGDPYEFQSNFFVKGDTTLYNRGGYHPVSSNPLKNYHTYTIDWTPAALTWYLDGTPVRILQSNDPLGFPQTPMQVIAGVWAGGDPSNAQGTIDWAGGETNYTAAPFSMHIKSVLVSDYSSGKAYSYEDNSGKWTSIESDGGEIDGREQEAHDEFKTLEAGGSVSGDFNPVSQTSVNKPTMLATAGPTESLSSGGHSPYPTLTIGAITINPGDQRTLTRAGSASSSGSSPDTRSTFPSVFIKTADNSSTTNSHTYSTLNTALTGITQPGPVPSYLNHPITGAASDYSSFQNPVQTFAKSSSNFGDSTVANGSLLTFVVIFISMLFV